MRSFSVSDLISLNEHIHHPYRPACISVITVKPSLIFKERGKFHQMSYTQFPKMNVFSGAETQYVMWGVMQWRDDSPGHSPGSGWENRLWLGQSPEHLGSVARPGLSWDTSGVLWAVGSSGGRERGGVCHTRAKDMLWCILAEKSKDRGWSSHQTSDVSDVSHRVWELLSCLDLDCDIRKWATVRCAEWAVSQAGHTGQVWGEGAMSTL